MTYLKAFAAATLVFLIVDLLWITFFVREAYDAALGSLMREQPAVVAALLFYLGYIAGILYFAVRPALATQRAATAAISGALLGALTYGTYALTNHAIFTAWTWTITLSDIAWGAFLTSVTAVAGYLAARRS
jgi:uncharacterized membrane protein